MNTTASPGGQESRDSASASSELSQWLYLHTALGKGYVSPLPYTPAWLITAGVPADLVNRMRAAENEFHAFHEQSLEPSRKELAKLEAEVRVLRKSIGVTPAKEEALRNLREHVAKPVFVNYRDWMADRATMLELLSKSKYRAMSFVDELGVRAHNYTVNKFLAARHISNDLALLSLSGDQSSDSVLIRSSATGGANMLSVRGSDTPRFNLITLTSPRAVSKIASRLKEAAPCQGITIALPTAEGDCLSVPASQIYQVISRVYATPDPNNRVSVQLSAHWAPFVGLQPSDVTKSEAGLSAIARSLCSVSSLVRAVVRAAVTRKFFLTDVGHADEPDRSLTLGEDDLAWARSIFDAVAPLVFGLKHLETRAENMAKAQQTWEAGCDPEAVVAAKMELVKAIKAEPDGILSMRKVIRENKAVTERLFHKVIELYPSTFTLQTDVRVASGRTVAFAVTLVDDRDSTQLSAGDEAELSEEIVEDLYDRWQEEAEYRLRQSKRPSIAIAEIPDALRPAIFTIQKKYWQVTTLVPSGPPMEEGGHPTMELWFRFNGDRRPMCNWSECFREWKLAEKWADKDEAAQENRQKIHLLAEGGED